MRSLLSRNKNSIFWATLIIATLPITLRSVVDCDIWWHMTAGRDFLLNGGVDASRFYNTPVTGHLSNLRFTLLGDIILYLVYLIGDVRGLQILRVFLVSLSCWFVFQCGDKKPTLFKWAILSLMIIGTYQLQIVRNSIISLVLVPVVMYLYDKPRKWLLVPIIGLWGCAHGSYLLGFGMLCLMSLTNLKEWRSYAIIIAASFILISIYNPLTKDYLSIHSVKTVINQPNLNSGILGKSPGKGKKRSIEFFSPFAVDRDYVKASITIGILAAFLIKPVYWIPYIAIMIFGLGYLRSIGYIGLVCVPLIFRSRSC